MKESTRRDDIRNLSLVWGAGITAGILTLAMLLRSEEPQVMEVMAVPEAAPVVVEIPEIEIQVEPVVPQPVVILQEVDSGSNRLYGTVVTVRGQEYEGYIRWDRNEGSWADLLDANKSGAAEYGRRVRVQRNTRDRSTVIRIQREHNRMQREMAQVARATAQVEREVAQAEREVAQAAREVAQVERELAREVREITRQAREIDRQARGNDHEGEVERARELAERIRSEFKFEFDMDSDHDADDDDHVMVVSRSGSRVGIVVAPSVRVSATARAVSRVASRVGFSQSFFVSGGTSLSGIRFGHVRSIKALDSRSALFTLKSGEQMELTGNATDLGSSMRAIIVEQANGREVELDWSDLDVVNFYPAPEATTPQSFRMYGTMMTRSGAEFTGYVTWDVDEIYSNDDLDGEERGYDHKIPFGDIESIERYSSRSAFVTLHNGDEMVLDGADDVNSSNGGISVSDPMLGQVKVRWDEFESVRFHPAETHAGYSSFDGGTEIFGTVVTDDGEEYTGQLVWDRDEAYTWEMLNGKQDGVEFHVEFSKLATVSPLNKHESLVTLKDGRTFELGGSNDVDCDNKGIVVTTDGDEARLIDWDDVREVRFQER